MSHNASHFLTNAKKILEGMKPLSTKKDPATAGVLGFLFGPLGAGVYLGSVSDFFWCLGLLVCLTIVVPGIGLIPGWIFSAWYAASRAATSNQNLALQSRATSAETMP